MPLSLVGQERLIHYPKETPLSSQFIHEELENKYTSLSHNKKEAEDIGADVTELSIARYQLEVQLLLAIITNSEAREYVVKRLENQETRKEKIRGETSFVGWLQNVVGQAAFFQSMIDDKEHPEIRILDADERYATKADFLIQDSFILCHVSTTHYSVVFRNSNYTGWLPMSNFNHTWSSPTLLSKRISKCLNLTRNEPLGLAVSQEKVTISGSEIGFKKQNSRQDI